MFIFVHMYTCLIRQIHKICNMYCNDNIYAAVRDKSVTYIQKAKCLCVEVELEPWIRFDTLLISHSIDHLSFTMWTLALVSKTLGEILLLDAISVNFQLSDESAGISVSSAVLFHNQFANNFEGIRSNDTGNNKVYMSYCSCTKCALSTAYFSYGGKKTSQCWASMYE